MVKPKEPENHNKRWTREEEEKVLNLVCSAPGFSAGLGRVRDEIKREYSAIIQRFTMTRLRCERAIHMLSRGMIEEGLRDLTRISTYHASDILIDHSLMRAVRRQGAGNLFSEKIMIEITKRELRGNRPFPLAKHYNSRLLIDED